MNSVEVDFDMRKPTTKTGGLREPVHRIFISHSSQDKDFAGQLDATLLANGVVTFLAERDIRVGESIPEKIYGGIDAATGLIYIVSTHSIGSRWVQEELSIAKMREKQSSGFRVFPVLIDELELPASILHVKYADFRSWRRSQAYREACLDLIRAMELTPRLIGGDDLRWYAARAEALRELDQIIGNAVGVLYGGLSANQTGSTGRDATPAHYMSTKLLFDNDGGHGILFSLNSLRELIDISLSSNRLLALRECTEAAITAGKAVDRRQSHSRDQSGTYGDEAGVSQFLWRLQRARDMLRELRGEFETILMSTVPFS